MEIFAIKNGKSLRCGYTTGSCAAAAAKAGAMMLLTGRTVPVVQLMTPKGIELQLTVRDISFQRDSVTCGIQKDAGDDPDITHGMIVLCRVALQPDGITLCGGEGVGMVTKAGLACPVGEWAINPVPRRMIHEALQDVAKKYGYDGGFHVTIILPQGRELAKKTFNPRLGIVGGLSILGTSGIVEPMSEQALIDTIHREMDMRYAGGIRHVLAFFGNYGVDFSRDTLHLDVSKRVTISNYVGEMLDYAVYKGFADVLLIGHIGKLLKVGQGIMNTHSRYADGRTTLLALSAMLHGAGQDLGRRLYESNTTDEAVRLLEENNLTSLVMHDICDKIEYYMDERVHYEIRTGAILFSNAYGVLGYTSQARELLAYQHGEETN